MTAGAGSAAPEIHPGPDGADSRAVLRHHGKSFHWAGRLLGRRNAARASALYHFCRAADDAVDEAPDRATARAALDRFRRAFAGRDRTDPAIRAFLDLDGVDHGLVGEFLVGIEQDTGPVRIADEDELLVYAYRVAGIVGLWMAQVLDARRPDLASAYAIDLGLAMQLTNIARDVVEDARRDRVYLPPAWTEGALEPRALLAAEPEAVEAMQRGRRRALVLAGRYYRSADVGLALLPARARLAIFAASRIYEAIGPRVLAASGEAVFERAFVPTPHKCRHTLRAAGAWIRSLARTRVPPHQPIGRRQQALAGLPGILPAAESGR